MGLRKEIPRFHSIAHTLIKRSGVSDRRQFVLYVLEGVDCQPKVFMPLVDYFIDHGRSRSSGWQREVARAVGLFIDYLVANREVFQDQNNRPQVLANFAETLVSGSIHLDGTDPSGLFWEPTSVNRATLALNNLTAFGDWMVNKYDTTAINPWRDASIAEQIVYWRRFDKRRAGALLAHTYTRENATQASLSARVAGVRRKALLSSATQPKSFPEARFQDLLTSGFVIAGKSSAPSFHERVSIRDVMITLLLHGGGLRESEPFHLYVSDVAIDPQNPKSALVRLYHPEQGRAPADYIDPISEKYMLADRETYLRTKWGMEPRNLVAGRFHAGWKDLMLTDGVAKYAQVHWFPSAWGELFLSLFKIYISKMRSRHSKHPFLFVSHKASVDGDPYTVDSYRQAHAKAVERCGLMPEKKLGTTPHGHRHCYGQNLVAAGVARDVIQRALHHKSIESQDPYTAPSIGKIATTLKEAEVRLNTPTGIPSLFNLD